MAGRPGDRWVGLRKFSARKRLKLKKAGREESPDTVVFASYAWDESFGANGQD